MCCFVFFVYCIVLCIVVPLPPGTYPLAANNNNNGGFAAYKACTRQNVTWLLSVYLPLIFAVYVQMRIFCGIAGLQAFTSVQLWSSLFSGVKQLSLLVGNRRFGTIHPPIFKVQAVFLPVFFPFCSIFFPSYSLSICFVSLSCYYILRFFIYLSFIPFFVSISFFLFLMFSFFLPTFLHSLTLAYNINK